MNILLLITSLVTPIETTPNSTEELSLFENDIKITQPAVEPELAGRIRKNGVRVSKDFDYELAGRIRKNGVRVSSEFEYELVGKKRKSKLFF